MEIFAGTADEFDEDARIIISHRKHEIGVFRHGGTYNAFSNAAYISLRPPNARS